MTFALIVSTLGRRHQLTRFLTSLDAQTYRNFEVILVDQNPPGFLAPVVEPFLPRLPIVLLQSAQGLSRARNIGLSRASANVFAFPDDDCWYPPHVLESVASLLTQNPEWDGLTGRLVDEEKHDGFHWYHRESGPIDTSTVWRRSSSATMFLRESLVQSVGRFDEQLGRGTATAMSAAEDSDYLIRALKSSFRLYFCADVCVFHSDSPVTNDRRRIDQAYGDSLSFGYLLRKYKYPFWFAFHTWLRALGGTLVSLLQGNRAKFDYHGAILRGRVRGWFGYSEHRSANRTATSQEISVGGGLQVHHTEALRSSCRSATSESLHP